MTITDHSLVATLRTSLRDKWPLFAVSMVCLVCVLTSLDPVGHYPNMPEGPGLTVDEVFNVQQGVYLIEQARSLGWLNLIPGTSQEAFRVENYYNPDHPPLGRYWLGIHHHLTWFLAPPFDVDPEWPFATACARTGSATAFALTVLLIGWVVTSWFGRMTGLFAAISLVLMPRLFGHAHLASLETITNLTCTAAVLSVVGMWNGPGPPTKRVSFLAGLILGCALLTKIQAILIPVPVVCWALWRWRQHAFLPLIIWGLTSLTFFYCLWPYLWSDPLGHSLEYLGRTTNRASIAVWYFGRKYVDKDVPWHYSFVLFGATVPLLLHGLGLLGLMGGPVRPPDSASPSAAAFRGRDLLLLSCLLFPLVVFALPGVAVYDGERLFLTSFPLWAIFIGRGWTVFWQKLLTWTHSISVTATIFVVLLTTLVWPLLAMSPCYLSYYNELFLVPGVADRTKMEVDYWGEGITRGLLKQVVERVPAGATVAIAPVLHQFQVEEYFRQSSILRQHSVRIVAYESRLAPDYVLVFRRLADLPLELNPDSTEFEVHVSTERGGRQLAFLAQRRSPKSKPAVTATKLID